MTKPTFLALLLCGLASGTSAHDTWFEGLAPQSGESRLAIGTGNRFPAFEFTVGAASLQRQGCRSETDALPLQAVREASRSLILRVPGKPSGPITCWAQQQPFEVEIAPQTVEVYFRDINASPSTREAWAQMRARGVAWKERYSKHARIELAGDRASRWRPRPVEMAMDVVLESSLPARLGDSLIFQVLRNGEPLPELAVEFRNDLSPIGIWKKTDAQGRVAFAPPLAANWLLRGTDLRPSASVPDTWESRFVTLAFDVR